MAENDAPPETATPDSPENPPEAPAESTAHEEGEKVPEWGKTLIQQVQSLTEAVTNSVGTPGDPVGAPSIDENPSPKPWHKRGGH